MSLIGDSGEGCSGKGGSGKGTSKEASEKAALAALRVALETSSGDDQSSLEARLVAIKIVISAHAAAAEGSLLLKEARALRDKLAEQLRRYAKMSKGKKKLEEREMKRQRELAENAERAELMASIDAARLQKQAAAEQEAAEVASVQRKKEAHREEEESRLKATARAVAEKAAAASKAAAEKVAAEKAAAKAAAEKLAAVKAAAEKSAAEKAAAERVAAEKATAKAAAAKAAAEKVAAEKVAAVTGRQAEAIARAEAAREKAVLAKAAAEKAAAEKAAAEKAAREAAAETVNPTASAPPPIALHAPQLIEATNAFSEAAIIGRGAYGVVFCVPLLPAVAHAGTVAVKRLYDESEQGLMHLQREVAILRTCSHENLLPLVGFCFEARSRCLVSPLCRGGSLDDRLLPSELGRQRLGMLGYVQPPHL